VSRPVLLRACPRHPGCYHAGGCPLCAWRAVRLKERRAARIEMGKRARSLRAWARELGLSWDTVRNRRVRGDSPIRALRPVSRGGRESSNG